MLEAFPVTAEQLAMIEQRVRPLLQVSLASTSIERLLCEAYFQGALDSRAATSTNPPTRSVSHE